ncbi:hypothetical protein OI25_8216 (plasmid) [Paraburkholderia fungorum]|jgi:hypothetical protein|uniref:Uncharacterized protein n=1 Tax=Paraburkholderia fungorum TaxID=134537 RepID=A0AAW3V724_9BURK|nr:hypothetical protein OI25_8216 [Paraburkholderia fungorum]MBB4516521.1 hypothetical protein [Paraburkholderia fungorum]MBB5545222.1 hypothetical protein [Paraburkholderia fungorum]MBB6205006.1 hypothetical protein [Paraburkholderia fungorum]PRZ52519.1 hypothetical protein BX589_114193 [Paraburkholderia fungorum]
MIWLQATIPAGLFALAPAVPASAAAIRYAIARVSTHHGQRLASYTTGSVQ